MSLNAHPFWLIIASAVIAIVPVFIGLLTSYLKVSIVLGMLRNALGTQQVPGALVIMSLSLALTSFIMGPAVEKTIMSAQSIDLGKLTHKIPSMKSASEFSPILTPWREFMEQHANPREIAVFVELDRSRQLNPPHSEALSTDPTKQDWRILIPSFVLTELKQAFVMAFLVMLPFLVIDLIVANILAGMGMTMMSPVLVSLPLKIVLFVVSDGWLLITRGLINSYQSMS